MKKLWVELHRPRNIENVIFADERIKKLFLKFIEEGEIPNLLLSGIQGTGKSSISKALIRDLKIDRMDVLRVACSDEKIDAMREKVKTFSNTMAVGKFKIVQLEEFDYLSQDAQALLRTQIEDTSSNCRFIATCNYVNKIIAPLRSRFQEFTFSAPNREECIIRGAEILEKENVEFELDDLEKVVAAGYPDMRKIIQLLEAGSKTGKLSLETDGSVSNWKLQLLPLLEVGDIKACRKVVCESASKEELIDAYRFLYDNVHRVKYFKNHLEDVFVLIAKYQYQHYFVADPELQMAALFCELSVLGE